MHGHCKPPGQVLQAWPWSYPNQHSFLNSCTVQPSVQAVLTAPLLCRSLSLLCCIAVMLYHAMPGGATVACYPCAPAAHYIRCLIQPHSRAAPSHRPVRVHLRHLRHSLYWGLMIMSWEPGDTAWPFCTTTLTMVPDTSASISFISFMASMMPMGWPLVTTSPSLT